MLSQCGQKHIPPLITGTGRLAHQHVLPGIRRLPAILLQELRNQPPTPRPVGTNQQPCQPPQGQRLIHLVTLAFAHPLRLVHRPTSTLRRDLEGERKKPTALRATNFAHKIKVGLTHQNAKTIITVIGDPLSVASARSIRGIGSHGKS